jgi:hypothetical protein
MQLAVLLNTDCKSRSMSLKISKFALGYPSDGRQIMKNMSRL